MNALQINGLLLHVSLNLDQAVNLELETLKQGKTLKFQYYKGDLHVMTSKGTTYSISAKAFKRIHERYEQASASKRTQVSYCTAPLTVKYGQKWEKDQEHIGAPIS